LRSVYAPDLRWSGPAGLNGDVEDAIDWISGWLTSLPDSSFLFERVIEAGERTAFLWRLIADEGERRLCLRGSTILTTIDGRVMEEDTIADGAMLDLQRQQPLLDL
jgi:hypothetical protein